MNNQNEIQKALAGLLIIQNENLKVQNPTIYRGFKQAQDALTELLKPAEVSGNIEQLKEVVQELETAHTCTHPHWTETPTKNLIIKTCSTCGAQKYE